MEEERVKLTVSISTFRKLSYMGGSIQEEVLVTDLSTWSIPLVFCYTSSREHSSLVLCPMFLLWINCVMKNV